jgi:hypothetical protein
MKISAILNGYRRPNTLQEQIQAIKGQECSASIELMYWQNTQPDIQYSVPADITSAVSNVNLGVWARFAYALNAKSDYVCIFDDDTIPGKLWFQNCLDTFDAVPDAGLLGTIGVIYTRPEYRYFRRVGWDCPNESATQADIVGHCWYFHRDFLSTFFRELPPLEQCPFVGEDIWASYMLQKFTNKKTYVPAHPTSNREMWGSLHGVRYGADGNETWSKNIHLMDADLKRAIANGFRLIAA